MAIRTGRVRINVGGSGGGGGAPSGSAGGSLTGTYPNPTIATIPSGATATTQAATDSSTKVATTAYVMGKERAFVLGKAGAIGATETDASDFFFIVPFDCTMLRMKSIVKSAASGASAVQLRTAAGPITSTLTWGNVSGFVTTFSNGNYVAVVDPANVNASEGDALGFSVGTGSGSDLLVEVVVVLR
jgi:hypothetical protein